MTFQPNSMASMPQALLSNEQAAIAFGLPFYYFRNPYKRKKLQIPHYKINKLVRYHMDDLRVWHAQLDRILKAQDQEFGQESESQSQATTPQCSEVVNA